MWWDGTPRRKWADALGRVRVCVHARVHVWERCRPPAAHKHTHSTDSYKFASVLFPNHRCRAVSIDLVVLTARSLNHLRDPQQPQHNTRNNDTSTGTTRDHAHQALLKRSLGHSHRHIHVTRSVQCTGR